MKAKIIYEVRYKKDGEYHQMLTHSKRDATWTAKTYQGIMTHHIVKK